MRALIVAPEPFFTPRGTPLSVYHRTAIMAELGVSIDLLTYGQGEDVELPAVRIVRIPRFRLFGPVRVGPSLLKLFLDGVLALWAVALLARNRYDFVHAHEESVFFCRYLKPLFGFRLVYDMHSSLPQQLHNFAYTDSRLLVGLFQRLENACLKVADAVITISPELGRYVEARIPDRGRHFLIENSVFDEVRLKHEREPADFTDWLQKEIPPEAAVIAYAGTLESYQGIELLLQAFAEVRKSRSDAFLLLIGGTRQQLGHYRALAGQLGVDRHCLFTGALGQRVARELLARASVLTSPRSEGINTPLKIYEQLASGIPLVATRILAHTQVVDDRVCFMTAPEPCEMAAVILSALGDDDRRARVVAAAQELYRRRYTRESYKAKLGSLLRTLG